MTMEALMGLTFVVSICLIVASFLVELINRWKEEREAREEMEAAIVALEEAIQGLAQAQAFLTLAIAGGGEREICGRIH